VGCVCMCSARERVLVFPCLMFMSVISISVLIYSITCPFLCCCFGLATCFRSRKRCVSMAQTALPRLAQMALPRMVQMALPRLAQTALPRMVQTALPRMAQTALPRGCLPPPNKGRQPLLLRRMRAGSLS